ncbi:MAG: CsgG/HfaB family protein [Polyangia bacterium]
MRNGCVIVALVCLGGVAHAATERAPLRVAVMDFTPASTTAEFEALGTGLQSMITTDLGELPTFVLVERARLKDIQAELHLSQTGAVDKATAAKIGSLAGASHLLVGSFTVVGGRMRIDARLFAVASGEIALSEKMEGAQTSFFELEQKLVRKIVDSVGVKLGRKEKADLAKPQTTDFEAFEKFSQGIALADEKKGPEAIAAMQAAVAKDPNFALAAAKLSQFQAMFPPLPTTPPKPPETQCKPNPLFQQPCTQPGQPPPTQPMIFTGDNNKSFGVVVRSQGEEARCMTPCELHLPPGDAQVEVLTPVHYTQTVKVPAGPSSLTVSGLDKTNLIIGSVLAAVALGATAATIGLHEDNVLGSPTAASQYWPLTFALATGAFFPAVYYLLHVGSNHARVRSLAP